MRSGCYVAPSCDSEHDLLVDDMYFSVLFDDDEVFPISDEKYAHELQLQEALVSSFSTCFANCGTQDYEVEPREVMVSGIEAGGSSSSSHPAQAFCMICMEPKLSGEMFRARSCSHSFCTDCTSKYISAKIQENIGNVRCPDLNCRGTFDPTICRGIVPKQVFDRWEQALCESMILGSRRVYCPYKDCSALMVDDGLTGGGDTVTCTECSICHRLFCAQCGIPWHSELSCREFKATKDGKELDEMAKALAKSKNWMPCPNCKFYVEKTSGCHHISCRCGFEFCYGCGRRWTTSHSCSFS